MKLISEYQDKTREEFANICKEIDELLKKYAPEWSRYSHNMDIGIIHHLRRHDFTKGKDQIWPEVEISEVPFAIERHDGNIQIADVFPIQVVSAIDS